MVVELGHFSGVALELPGNDVAARVEMLGRGRRDGFDFDEQAGLR